MITDKLKGFKLDFGALKDLNDHDKKAEQEALIRIEELEKLSFTKFPEAYREGFIQGFIEASWKRLEESKS